MLHFPLIQVAGVIDADEAHMLVESGVRTIGFPLRLNVHREDIDEDAAARIIAGLRAPVTAVLITYLDTAAGIDAFARRMGAGVVQLHGDVATAEMAALRRLAPDLAVTKSLVVGAKDNAALERDIDRLSPWVDAFITDTYDPVTGASGATGKTHDWSVSRRLVERSERPVILAGGLTPENVSDAIAAVRPQGVDTHTGVEGPDGRKVRGRVEAFVTNAVAAFGRLSHRPDNGD